MKKTFKIIGIFILCFLPFLAAQGIQFVATIILALVNVVFLSFSLTGFQMENYVALLSDANFNMAIMLCYGIITTILLGTWYHVATAQKYVPKRKLRHVVTPKIVFSILLLSIALQYVSNYLVIAIAALKPSLYEAYANLLESAGMTEITLLMAVYSVLVAPICEEIIFRGVTLHYARKSMPFWGANLLQAALFGVYHMNVVQGVYAFFVGLVCGYIFKVGQSLYLAIGFHIAFNIWGSGIQLPFYSGNNQLLALVQLFLAVFFMMMGLFLYKKSVTSRQEKLLLHSDSPR